MGKNDNWAKNCQDWFSDFDNKYGDITWYNHCQTDIITNECKYVTGRAKTSFVCLVFPPSIPTVELQKIRWSTSRGVKATATLTEQNPIRPTFLGGSWKSHELSFRVCTSHDSWCWNYGIAWWCSSNDDTMLTIALGTIFPNLLSGNCHMI